MFNYSALMGSLSIVRDSDEFLETVCTEYGIREDTLNKVLGSAPWLSGERPEIRRALDAIVYAYVDVAGLPRIDLPAEFVAAVLAVYVDPVNLMVASVFMEGKHNWVDQTAQAANDPIQGLERISASEMFSTICEILGCEEYGRVRDRLERKMARKVSDPLARDKADA